ARNHIRTPRDLTRPGPGGIVGRGGRMARYPVEDTHSGVPVKTRRFPWRLWLYALLMTAVAGAGGYFAWYYRNEAATATNASSECKGSLDPLTRQAEQCKTEAAESGQK